MSSPLRVLLVEDSDDDAALVTRELEKGGFDLVLERVDTAGAMESALDRTSWDVIIADYSLPSFSGPGALEVVRSKKLDVPFILVSGSIGEDVAVRAMKAGAHDYLLKQNLSRLGPAVSRELREAVGRQERRRAEATLRFFAEASVALAESLDVDATLTAVARLAVPYLADWCIVDMIEHGAASPRSAAIHVDPEKKKLLQELQMRYPPEPESSDPAAAAIRTGTAQLLADVSGSVLSSMCRSEEHADLLRRIGIRTAIAVPLIVRGKTLGAVSLGSAGRGYGTTELAVAEELARRAAMAIDNARLYRDAQEAIHSRDEFLTVAAHEFRTPLTTLQLQVQSITRSLRKHAGEGVVTPLVSKLTVADQQLVRMKLLVERLLDVSIMTAHRLPLELEDVDLVALVTHVTAGFQSQMKDAGCAVTVETSVQCVGMWDRARLDQLVTNLLSNAVKYGPHKPIEVRVWADDATASIAVRDHGIGIAPADQARIFERFERAVSTSHYGGFGLGLWLVRLISEALGGTVHVDSELGAGATFTVSLPRARAKPSTGGT